MLIFGVNNHVFETTWLFPHVLVMFCLIQQFPTDLRQSDAIKLGH